MERAEKEKSSDRWPAQLAARFYRIAPVLVAIVIFNLMICVAVRAQAFANAWLILVQSVVTVIVMMRGVRGWSLSYLLGALLLSSFVIIPLGVGERALPLFASGVAAVAWLYATVHGRGERRGYGAVERMMLVKSSVYLGVAILGFVLIMLSLFLSR